jgi:hypothetical protein
MWLYIIKFVDSSARTLEVRKEYHGRKEGATDSLGKDFMELATFELGHRGQIPVQMVRGHFW